jgi:hypothetical protein
VRGADNLTAICEPIVWKMWEPRRLTALWAFTACYRDTFTFFYVEVIVLMCLAQDRSTDRSVRRPRTLPSLEGGSNTGGARCELKLYVGGSETTPAATREKNVMRARCMASRMLGELGWS